MLTVNSSDHTEMNCDKDGNLSLTSSSSLSTCRESWVSLLNLSQRQNTAVRSCLTEFQRPGLMVLRRPVSDWCFHVKDMSIVWCTPSLRSWQRPTPRAACLLLRPGFPCFRLSHVLVQRFMSWSDWKSRQSWSGVSPVLRAKVVPWV